MNKSILNDDMHDIYDSFGHWESLYTKSILITGATGMLAKYIVFFLQYLNAASNADIKIYILVRNREKALKAFGPPNDHLIFVVQDIVNEIKIDAPINYIIHAAGGASPYQIVHNPTGIISTNTIGTINVLEFARHMPIDNILYTSTREVYGEVKGKHVIEETDLGLIDPLASRSCYPESKRMGENIFKSYFEQYNIPFTIARIAHAYGPGMGLTNDGRVLSDFLANAIEHKKIVINSSGNARRSFCYITDAVSAIFILLLKGNKGEAYNVANEKDEVSLKELASCIEEAITAPIDIQILNKEEHGKGYCNYDRVQLSTDKLEKLGWSPVINLNQGLEKTLDSFV